MRQAMFATGTALGLVALLGLAPAATAGEASGYEMVVAGDGQTQVIRDERAYALSTSFPEGGDQKQHKVRVVVVGDGEAGEEEEFDFQWKTEGGQVVGVPGGRFEFLSDLTSRGYLGVQLTELTPELRRHFGGEEDAGVLVGSVEVDSPAFAAGVQVGDLLTAIDGERVGSSLDVRRRVRALGEGDVVDLEVIRGGAVHKLSANIVERERPEVDIRRFIGRHEGDDAFVYRIDEDGFGDALEKLQEHFANPDFRRRMESIHERGDEMHERLQRMEQRLKELERLLEEREDQE